jgi:hypothetical protein
MNIRERMRETEKARKFWQSLSTADRWALGDQMVLGELDYLDWFDGKRPSSAFMMELDYQRALWEAQ